MEKHQKIWQVWVDFLDRWHLKDLIMIVLDAGEPLRIIGAQVIYLGQPFLNGFIPADHLTALSEMLENQHQARKFVSFARRYHGNQPQPREEAAL